MVLISLSAYVSIFHKIKSICNNWYTSTSMTSSALLFVTTTSLRLALDFSIIKLLLNPHTKRIFASLLYPIPTILYPFVFIFRNSTLTFNLGITFFTEDVFGFLLSSVSWIHWVFFHSALASVSLHFNCHSGLTSSVNHSSMSNIFLTFHSSDYYSHYWSCHSSSVSHVLLLSVVNCFKSVFCIFT